MKRLLLSLALLLSVNTAHGQVSMLLASRAAVTTPTLVDHNIGQVSGGTATTGAMNTTGASLIACAVSGSGASAPVMTDSAGNTYTQAGSSYGPPGANVNRIWFFNVASPITGSGHTVSATYANSWIACAAFKTTLASSPLDSTNGGASTGSVTTSAGALTPSQNNTLILAAVSLGGAQGVTSVDSSFTITDVTPPGASLYPIALAYLVQSTAGAVNPTFTANSSTDFATWIGGFKP